MEDKDRKFMTEWLGECWHEPESYIYDYEGGEWAYDTLEPLYKMRCKKCKKDITEGYNRTFTTPDDMMAVKERLVETNSDHRFTVFLEIQFDSWLEEDEDRDCYFWDWLINPPRFCQLAAYFLKEGENGNS